MIISTNAEHMDRTCGTAVGTQDKTLACNGGSQEAGWTEALDRGHGKGGLSPSGCPGPEGLKRRLRLRVPTPGGPINLQEHAGQVT